MIKKFKNIVNSENRKRLISNFLSLIVLRGFQYLIPLVTLPYLVRTIGIENFGLINFALSLGVYFGAIIQFGFGITATREIARHREDPVKLEKIYSVTLSASLILAIICSILFTFVVLTFDKFRDYSDLYFYTLALIVFQSLFPVWFFQGMEKMKYITFLSLSANVMYLISLFLFVKEQNDFMLVPLLQGFFALVNYALAILLICKKFNVKFHVPKLYEIKNTYQNGQHAFIAQLVPNVYTNSAVFLLGVFANNAAVGLFTSATKIIDALGSLVYVFSNTFLPYLSRHIEKHKVFQKIMLGTGFGIAAFLFLLAEFVVNFMYGDIDLVVVLYIQVLSVAIFLIFIQITYGQNYLMLVGQEVLYKNIIVFSSLFSLLYSFVLIYLYGAWGSVFTLIFTRILISFFTIRAYRRHACFEKKAS